jgi:predicted phage terminase large subunit-like protein
MATVGYSEKENLIYAMDFYRAHLTFPEQLAAIAETWKVKRASRIIIESTAYQKALAQGVQGMGLPVVPYKTLQDKVTRVLNISPYFENHMIRCKEDQDEFIHEYVQFDKGDHDDLLDALTLAVQDIIDRHVSQRFDYHPLVALGHVFKSRIMLPVSAREANTLSLMQGKSTTKPIMANRERIVCLTCGLEKGKGSCKH